MLLIDRKKLLLCGLSLLLSGHAWAQSQHVAVKGEHAVKQQQIININHADAVQLAHIKGVGKTLAQRIVAYRKQHGRFATLADLRRVKGISAHFIAAHKQMLATN